MMDIIVNIMIEVLTILAIATKEIKQRRARKYMNRLLGKNDIESALKRLDTLAQEEARMATVEVLKTVRGVDGKVNRGVQSSHLLLTYCLTYSSLIRVLLPNQQ